MVKDVLIALKSGDHKAFEVVFIAYFNKVKYFINGLVKSESDAEELAQEIFVKLWVGRESIVVEKSFSSYLYVIARNAAFNFIKSRLVRDSYLNDQIHNSEDSATSEEVIVAKETELLLKMIVSKMPEQRRRIYEMSRNQGLKNDEIAQQLNISKKTVENQLSLALKELRQVFSMFLSLFV